MNSSAADVLLDETLDDWTMLGDGDVVVVDEASAPDKLERLVPLWETMKINDDESWETDPTAETIDIEEANTAVGIVKRSPM